MSDAAWTAIALIFVALFGAGGYFQWRRTKSVERELNDDLPPIARSAAEAKAGIEALLPVIQNLQSRLADAEDNQVELMILLAAHGEWDMRVLAEIRKHDPDFPDPPPLRPKELK